MSNDLNTLSYNELCILSFKQFEKIEKLRETLTEDSAEIVAAKKFYEEIKQARTKFVSKIPQKKQKVDETISARVTPELKQRVAEFCSDRNITVTNLITYLLEQELTKVSWKKSDKYIITSATKR